MAVSTFNRLFPAQAPSWSARVWSGTFWMVLANVASRGLLMAAMMLTARLLGKADYGELGMVQSTLAMFETVAMLGMGLTATRHIAEYRRKDPAKIARIVALTQFATLSAGCLLGLAIYGAAPWLAGSVLGVPRLCEPLRVSAAILALNALAGGYGGILAGFEAYKAMAAINTLAGAVTLPLVVGGAAGFGVMGALLGLFGVSLANVLMSMAAVRRRLRRERVAPTSRLTRAELRLLWSFSLPAMLAGITIAPVNWAGAALLVRQAGYAQMGLYSAANQWFSILLFLPGVLTVVFLPLLAGHGNGREAGSLSQLLKAGVKTAFCAAAPPAVLVAALGPWIMRWYGAEYAEAYPLLGVVALTATLAATQNMLSNALAVADRMWVNFLANLLWGTTSLAVAYTLLQAGHAAMALCLAACAAYLVKLLFTVALVARRIS
jgi:O-antigen/teichoic acid export membrane protein